MDSSFATTVADSSLHTGHASTRAAQATRESGHDSFLTQTPLALLALACVAAIIAINRPPSEVMPVTGPGTPMAATVAEPLERHIASCADCGEVVSVELVSLHPEIAPAIKTYQFGVRLDSGAVKTVRQFAPPLEIGARVRLSRTPAALAPS